MKKISIGNQSFASIREKSCFYIDKTNFIMEWWESEDIVTLITRPRRFGKTLNMDMLNCFFSNQYTGRSDLFEGLSVWIDEKYRKLQGTYPVIFLSFASVKATNYKGAYIRICQLVTDLYHLYADVLSTGQLSKEDCNYIKSISDDMEESVLIASLNRLCTFFHKIYGRNTIVILDEYDTPMQEAYVSSYWEKFASLIRSLFNTTFKTNPHLERGIMTGITRISKESIFSDLNNLKIVTTTSNEYKHAFGFTEKEVFQALDEFHFSDKKEKLKAWYDGFTFGNETDIYNPWSITNFLDMGKFDTYWANTSANSLIDTLIQEGDIQTKQVMEDLLEGKPLLTELDEQIVFDQLTEDETAIWSLMLASGYLKQNTIIEPSEGILQYKLVLTNKEVHIMFRNMIRKWFRRKDAFAYNEFIRAFLQNDKKAMNHYMNKIALNTFSYFDTGKKPSEQEPERFYHGFVLGLMVELKEQYSITSNRESGFGRYDVMLEPISSEDMAYVLEFKVYDGESEESLKDTVAAAHKQMEEKQYDAKLWANGINKDNIIHYGFAIKGKEVLIG